MSVGEPSLAQTLPTAGTARPVLASERYELRRELARGGQSQVFVAFDRQLSREVAFKVPLPGADGKVAPDAEARFLREARITARLDHPNIITVHEIGRATDGRLFCAQRLVEGDATTGRVATLGSAMREASSATARLALLPRLLDVSNAVAFAHSVDIVHRDLKPENVVLGRLGETVVLDWGLGRVLSDAADDIAATSIPPSGTLDGEVFGTPLYMSPEQARGVRALVGKHSDVWSLGVMLYELLSGTTPFVGPSLPQLLEQVRGAPVPPIEAVAPGVPRALAAITRRALERDETKRYADAGAFADDLRAFLEGRAVGAYDYTTGELLRLFIRRNRTAAVVGTISFVVLLVAVIALARSVRENRQSLAEAFVEKGRLAESGLRWEEASVWYAAARELSTREDAAAGLRVVWPRTQQEKSMLLFGHTAAVRALASSPDGNTLYSAGVDRSIRVWDVTRGTTTRVLEAHTHTVNALAVSADGSALYSGGEDDLVRRWDTRTGASEVMVKTPDAVNALTLSPDGTVLAIACEDNRVYLIDLVEPKLREPFSVHSHPVYTVAFSRDGTAVASGSWDGEIQVRNRESQELIASLKGHQGSVLSLTFAPTQQVLVSSGRDTTVRFWNTQTWTEMQSVIGNTQKVYAVAWSDDGDLVASAGADGTSRVWAGFNRRPMPGTSLGRDDELLATTFLHHGTMLATGGRRGLIALRLITPNSPLITNAHEVNALTELDDGRLVMEHNDGFAFVSADLSAVKAYPLDGGDRAPTRSMITNRAGTLAFGSASDATVRFYDVRSDTLLAKLSAHTMQIDAFALSPDETMVATGSKDGRLLVWNVATRDVKVALPTIKDGFFGAAFSPNGKWLAAAGYDRKVRLYDTTTWELVRALEGHEHGVKTVAFAPDSRTLASAGWDRSVRLWNVETGTNLMTLFGHQDVVTSLAFSPDGKRLASSSFDSSIRLWDVDRAIEVVRFTPDEGRVNQVLFSRDGQALYYARQGVHRIDLRDVAVPNTLAEVLEATDLELKGLRLVWTPRPR